MNINIPKRFKLAKAATDHVILTNNQFLATDGEIAVGLKYDWDTKFESYVQRAICTKAITEATRGIKGEGSLDVTDADKTVASSGPGKPATAYDNPREGIPSMPAITAIRGLLETAGGPMQVALDGAALGRLQEAMGADGGVILSFDPENPQAPIKVEAVHVDQRGAEGAISRIVWQEK